nr:hypothetical protein [Tanacetum cinerariifolium]
MPFSSEHPCRRFSLAEIQLATNNFDPETIIGKEDLVKCIKVLLMVVEQEQLSQSNGYYNEFNEMLVVNEYISGGYLAKCSHKVDGKSIQTPLSWVEHLKKCIGAARALDYLHTGIGVKNIIIHRDVKSSNILLDGNMAANVSDLELSKLVLLINHVLILTRKSNVYSFGVVLLEILCGRPAIDPSLRDDELGLTQPKDRPTMSEVIVDLEAALALQERGEYLVRSRYNNSERISSSSYSKS